MSKNDSTCLSVQVLDQVGQNEVSPNELISIEEHLSECQHCREMFDRVYASPQWSEHIRPALIETQMLISSISDDEASHQSAVLKLLGPTDDPDMLGRIGNYEIAGVIGQGGMGVVFKGFDRSLNRFVAIKMLLPHLAASGAARKRFAREGQAVAAVVDDHVMAIHCVDEWQGVPYLVMTYSRGVSLQKRLNDNGPLEVREILRIGMQAAKGLAAAHAQGIVHRDIKPSNILLDKNVERVQLVDFGLARAVDDASLTCSGTLAGTPQYMSPEQARAETVDHRSDLFSLGSVLYAMCTGYPPFRAESSYSVLRLITDKEPRPILEINSEIPDWLAAIIRKLMAKHAVDRFESAKQVSDLLEACLAHVQQPTITPLPPRVAQLSSIVIPTSAVNQPQCSLDKVIEDGRDTKTNHRRQWYYSGIACPPIIKYVAAAAFAFSLIFAGVLIVLELDKGTLTIESEADNVPIRIKHGDKVVEKLAVSQAGKTVRVAAGKYMVEIDGDIDGIEIKHGDVLLKRNGVETVKIAKSDTPPKQAAKDQNHSDIDSTATNTSNDPLIVAIDLFNERLGKRYPNHDQPLLTKDELVACASWNVDGNDELSESLRTGLATIAKQHQLPVGWTIDGEYIDMPPTATPVRAFQIFLQRDQSDERFTVRERFVAPPNSYSKAIGQNDQDGGISLASAVNRFNAGNSRADGKKQPPLTEDEVVAAIIHRQSRRDDDDVSDSLFGRFQNIARTRRLPEGATLEVIPTFGVEGGSTYTIWSIRVEMLQDEAGKEGWTYAFEIRQQFVSVKHRDAGSIHWGTPAENGLQAGVRLSPLQLSYQLGQKMGVELFYRNILTKPMPATIPNFPSYEVDVYDKDGAKLEVFDSRQEQIIGGWRAEQIGDEPLSLRGQPVELIPSTLTPDERAKVLSRADGQVLIFVKPGQSCRLQLTVANYASDAKGTLKTGEVEFAADATASQSFPISSLTNIQIAEPAESKDDSSTQTVTCANQSNPAADLRIAGRCVDENGKPIADAMVDLYLNADAQRSIKTRQTREDGTFDFGAFPDPELTAGSDVSYIVVGRVNGKAIGSGYGMPHSYSAGGFEDFECVDSTKTNLGQILPKTGKRLDFKYEYDFGDGWAHEVLFEGTPPVDPKAKYPLCVEGERACPPEDCGGVWGYGDLLEAIRNPEHEEHEDMLELIDGPFDPEKFDAKQATKAMKKGLPDWRSMR